MIVSAHQFTGFWFESNLDRQQGLDQRGASDFLTAALGILSDSDHREGQLRGAINTGFDPSLLSHRLPGYAWLKDRIQWMKQTLAAFDDAPGQGDPGKRRNPFPAFLYAIEYAIGGVELPLDGVQVLVGHDFVVVHEFRISPPRSEDVTPAYDILHQRQFAHQLGPSASLFSADFTQLSEQGAIQTPPEWSEDEFAAAFCPKVTAALKCAMRSYEGRYSGCVLVNGGRAKSEIFSQVQDHIKASAYLTFLCTAIVNDAKVQYERQVANAVIEDLEGRLASRSDRIAALLVRGFQNKASTADSINLVNAHLTDRKVLNRFEQLVDTCSRNSDQFCQVVSKLMEPDNRWAAAVRKRLIDDKADLAAAQQALRRHFDTSQAFVDRLGQVFAAPVVPGESEPNIRDTLEDFQNQLRRLRLDCNAFCMAFAEFRLFEPSAEALDDLDIEIRTPVASVRDFRCFILALHQVFDEGVLDKSLRCWQQGQQLADPLTQVAAILHAENFRQLTILRNQFAAHDTHRGDAVQKRKQLLDVFQRLVDVRTTAGFKEKDWLRLQKAVLVTLSSVLEEVIQVFQNYQNGMRRLPNN